MNLSNKMLWTEKHKPKINELVNIDIKRILTNLESKKPLLFLGPTGTAKTSTVYAISYHLNYEVIELNASTLRNKEQIDRIIKTTAREKSFFKKGKIILIDELEGLNRNDRGCIQELMEIVEISNFPIILISQELERLESIKRKVTIIKFEKPKAEAILQILKVIANKENIKYEEELLKKFSRSYEDIRSAIIDFQILSEANKEFIYEEINERSFKEEINSALTKIFKTNNLKIAINSIDNLNLLLYDPIKKSYPLIFNNEETLLYYLEENIPLEHKELEKSFNLLSKADVFHGRISRQQYFRFNIYIKTLMAFLTTIASNKAINNYKKTSRSPKENFRLWSLVSKRKTDIVKKLAIHTNTSTKKISAEFNYYKIILKNNPNIQTTLKLIPEEIEYLNKI